MRILEVLTNVSEPGHVELPIPAPLFGAIAFGIFLLLAAIAWSYRDVANRHEHKDKDSKASH
ncbi:MAG: hypothetical protein ACK4VJ_06205 [Rhodoluna sp.]